MGKTKTIERDAGWRAHKRAARAAKGIAHRVGIFQPKVARYALIQEARRPFLRPAVDEPSEPQDRAAAELRDEIAAGRDPRPGAKALAETHAVIVRKNIQRQGLIDTGALFDSIEVREK